jgi:hypothetical protein
MKLAVTAFLAVEAADSKVWTSVAFAFICCGNVALKIKYPSSGLVAFATRRR